MSKNFTFRIVFPLFCTWTHFAEDTATYIHHLCRKYVDHFTQGKKQNFWDATWCTSRAAMYQWTTLTGQDSATEVILIASDNW